MSNALELEFLNVLFFIVVFDKLLTHFLLLEWCLVYRRGPSSQP